MKSYRITLIVACAYAFGLIGCQQSQPTATQSTTPTPADTATFQTVDYSNTLVETALDTAQTGDNQSLTGDAGSPFRKVRNKGLIQQFTIDGDEMNTLRGMNGITVHLPRHCFRDDNQRIIGGNIQVQLVEGDDMSDFVALGIPTRTEKGILKTQGMYYINAFKKGKPLQIDPAKPLLVQIPKNLGLGTQELFFAVQDNAGQPVWRHLTNEERTTWKVVDNPVQPAPFVTTYSPAFCAYKCYDKVQELVGKTATPLMEHLQHIAGDTVNGKTPNFATEGLILRAKPRVSKLEKEMQKYIFVQDKVFTRDRKGANEAEKLTGLRILPVKLSGTVLLTDQEAVFYNLTPAIEPAERILQMLDRYPYLKDNKHTLIALENTANTTLNAMENAPVFENEEDIVKMIHANTQADERPTYFHYKGMIYANLKAVRLFAPTFSMKDEAVHDGKLKRANFKSPAINARFVEFKHFSFMVQDLYSDLAKGSIMRNIPQNVPFDQLVVMSKNIVSYRQTAMESERQAVEFFWFKNRFYVARQYLNPLIHTLAHREGYPEPTLKAHELMNRLATVYHRNDLKDPYLKYNYMDVTVAVNKQVRYAQAEQRDEVYQAHESLEIIRKNAYQDSLADAARHNEAITCNQADKYCVALIQTGWVAVAQGIKPEMVKVSGKICGVIPDNAVTLHVVSPDERTYLTFHSKDGLFEFTCPRSQAVKVMARFGNNVGLATYNPLPREKNHRAGELTLLLRKPKDIDSIIATL